jgi:hypothetical protein
VTSHRSSTPPRCREIRAQLEDFGADRLGARATGDVRGHLRVCDDCSLAFAEVLAEQVIRGGSPLLEAPAVPPVAEYERLRQAASSRLGLSWRSVRDALHAGDLAVRQWAAAKLEELQAGFDAIGGTRRVEIRTRGRAKPSPLTLDAGGVSFDVVTPPAIGDGGRFTMTLSTRSAEAEGRTVSCTIALPGAGPVSFEAVVTRHAATFDEEGVGRSPRRIPLRLVTLSLS